MSVETELAWAAGFFDGEGTVFVNHTKSHKGGTTGKHYPCTSVEISVCQTREEPILRFFKAIDLGRTCGPYQQKAENHKPYWRWETSGRPNVLLALERLWPYLTAPKQEQARRVWAELERLKTPKSPKLPDLPKENYV